MRNRFSATSKATTSVGRRQNSFRLFANPFSLISTQLEIAKDSSEISQLILVDRLDGRLDKINSNQILARKLHHTERCGDEATASARFSLIFVYDIKLLILVLVTGLPHQHHRLCHHRQRCSRCGNAIA